MKERNERVLGWDQKQVSEAKVGERIEAKPFKI